MKTSIVIKVFFLLPAILFFDYILLALIGCKSCLLGLGEKFYCGSYCIFGKIILGLTAVFFLFPIFPDIIHLFKMLKNATTTEKQKSL